MVIAPEAMRHETSELDVVGIGLSSGIWTTRSSRRRSVDSTVSRWLRTGNLRAGTLPCSDPAPRSCRWARIDLVTLRGSRWLGPSFHGSWETLAQSRSGALDGLHDRVSDGWCGYWNSGRRDRHLGARRHDQRRRPSRWTPVGVEPGLRLVRARRCEAPSRLQTAADMAGARTMDGMALAQPGGARVWIASRRWVSDKDPKRSVSRVGLD
jgi:hypothetical protein